MIARVLVMMAVVIGAMLGPAPHGRAASSTLCTAHQTGYMKVVPPSNNGNNRAFSQLEVCFGQMGQALASSPYSGTASYRMKIGPGAPSGPLWIRVDIIVYHVAGQDRLTGGALAWLYGLGNRIGFACGGCTHTMGIPHPVPPPPYYMGIGFAPVQNGFAVGSVAVARQESLFTRELTLALPTASPQ